MQLLIESNAQPAHQHPRAQRPGGIVFVGDVKCGHGSGRENMVDQLYK
jgi:hypothetical protein